MAVYKVPQDVEAEDKLIGPFGFRQFIYLIIVAFSGFVAYLLSQIFIGLVLIPAPIIIFFLAIALPLRKDQPTEVYLAAILQYNLKSKKRMWKPDGVLGTVEITAPKLVEERRTKDITEEEALDRLGHLAQIMDTRGWAARGVFNPDVNSTGNVQLTDNVVAEADEAEDILDEGGTNAKSFDELINQQKAISRQAVTKRMNQATQEPPTVPTSSSTYQKLVDEAASASVDVQTPAPQSESAEDLAVLAHSNAQKYPTMHQQIIQPISNQPVSGDDNAQSTTDTTQSTSDNLASPDIINIVNDLKDDPNISIATMSEIAHRKQQEKGEEVEIKLH